MKKFRRISLNKTLIALVMLILISPMVMGKGVESVSPSPYYDNQPNVWGDHIVWRRAINNNGNQYIDLREPSWIMLYSIKSGKSWSITPVDTVMKSDIYQHAESPDIWGNKVIYEAQVSPNSYDTKLFMYNISSEETWELPIQATEYAHGHLHVIWGDWIAYTDISQSGRQAYLYNYKDSVYRTLVSRSDPYSTYGMVIGETHVAVTVTDEFGTFNIWIQNLETGDTTEVGYTNGTQIIATSIYGNEVGVSAYEPYMNNMTRWNSYIFHINNGIFEAVQEGGHGLLLWENTSSYEGFKSIHIDGMDTVNRVVDSTGQVLRLGDMYEGAVVWVDNKNSDTMFGDARDNFDVYVFTMKIDKEFTIDPRILIIVAIVVIVIGVVAKRMRMSRMV